MCWRSRTRGSTSRDPAQAWERLRGIGAAAAARRAARAKAIAVWRETLARDRDLPRAWILPDAAIFDLAQREPDERRGAARGPRDAVGLQ